MPKNKHSNRFIAALVLGAIAIGIAIGLALQPAPVSAPLLDGQPKLSATNTPVATLPIRYAPDASPEAQPVLTLELMITDAESGRPIKAKVWAGGVLVAEGVSQLDIGLRLLEPGRKTARLRIEAEGYETWEQDVRFRVLYSRRMPFPIQLQPLPIREGGGV